MRMKQIPLTRGMSALVDDEDYDELIKHKWHASSDSYNIYACRTTYSEGHKHHNLLMHRVIMGDISGIMYDHIDGNGLNNQKLNLRIVTHTQNTRNRKNNSIGSSRYKGVYWGNQLQRWVAKIRGSKNQIYIGSFKVEEEAARAYNKKAVELFGEYARLNIIDTEPWSIESLRELGCEEDIV